MKNQIPFFCLILIFSCVLNLQSETKPWPVLKGPYLGQPPPGDRATLFMDGIISCRNEPEMCAAFTPDGKEFYFNRLHEGQWAIFLIREVKGIWTKPEPLPFTGNYTDRDFTISPDGNRIYFGSNRPLRHGDNPSKSLDLWVTKRKKNGEWGNPDNLGPPVNTRQYGENYPSVARNGNLYFFSCRNDGLGGCDIYVSRWKDGGYQTPENLGPAVNSEKHDWDAFIAPDESYIIFSSQNREDTLGDQDLYVSFRANGVWTRAVNMGARVNSFSSEICPSVTPDGKYLFFTSRRRGKADIYWVSSDIIGENKPQTRFQGDYLGKKPPGIEPEIFDSGKIAGDMSLFNISFSPDGKELFFSYHHSEKEHQGPEYEIRHLNQVDGVWSAPEAAFFSGKYSDADITFSPQGKRVFFASDRPHLKSADMDIYFLKKTENGWSQPIYAGTEVNTIHNEVYPTCSSKGNLFFASNRPGGYGDKDIYKAELVDGKFTHVGNLGPSINTNNLESDCFVAPDESYILFNTIRPENNNRIHIYVSFQINPGQWTKGEKLPGIINVRGEHTGFATVTADGKFLFYSARRGENKAIYWVSTGIITDMKRKLVNTGRGTAKEK
jgi:Tol biopolymer transport system component